MGLSPRVRGNRKIASAAASVLGLSPRVRGNRVRVPANSLFIGSIPACTGEPWFEWLPIHHLRVYPRVYGGTSDTEDSLQTAEGLSPRVRGNRP